MKLYPLVYLSQCISTSLSPNYVLMMTFLFEVSKKPSPSIKTYVLPAGITVSGTIVVIFISKIKDECYKTIESKDNWISSELLSINRNIYTIIESITLEVTNIRNCTCNLSLIIEPFYTYPILFF